MKNLSGLLAVLAIFLCALISYGQNSTDNLLNSTAWPAGSSQLTDFQLNYSSQSENIREPGQDPFGNPNSIIWKAIDAGDGDLGGGWNTSYVENIDPSKTYRFTVWLKKDGTGPGFSLFGAFGQDASNQHTLQKFDGTAIINPYFSGWTNPPNPGEWYLYVGYIHPSTYVGASIGRIYDTSGTERGNLTDYKMSSSTTKIAHRAFLAYDSTDTELHLFQPTISEVDLSNGQPSGQDLVDGPNNDTPGGDGPSDDTETAGGHWTKPDGSQDIHYTVGNVGIGTTALSTYKLAVDGSIRSREVKVDNASWADYVFYEEYKLPTLLEVEQHIQEKGHLINIPSAEEVKANGILLGEMNKLLLEKIEELTLYIIQQEKAQKQLENRIKSLEKE